MKTLKTIRNFLFISAATLSLTSCSKDNNDGPSATLVKEWSIPLSTKNENPAVFGRNETGTATMQLFSDNSLTYTIAVSGLASGDALNAAHLHAGDVITNGGVILGLNPSFSGGNANGTVENLPLSLVDSLKNNVNDIYFNVHSVQSASGLVRGQINVALELAADVTMTGANEVPAVTTTATGLGQIRMTADKKVYTRVTINNLEAADAMTAAHIHRGAAGVNGPVIVGFYSSAAEFGTAKIITVDDATYFSLRNDPIYFNAHSTANPAGKVRGQIRP